MTVIFCIYAQIGLATNYLLVSKSYFSLFDTDSIVLSLTHVIARHCELFAVFLSDLSI
jgi:hypothetical protein